MLAFLVTLIKVIAPWVAAAVVIHYLNVYNEKKHPEFYNLDDKKTPQSLFENLEIGYPFELALQTMQRPLPRPLPPSLRATPTC